MGRRGCKMIFAMTKADPRLDMRRIFERLGFGQTDFVMAKWIADGGAVVAGLASLGFEHVPEEVE